MYNPHNPQPPVGSTCVMRFSIQEVEVGPFLVDLTTGRVRRDGVELNLRRQAVRALKTLIQNSGQYVDYERMISEAWDGIVVSRHTVDVTVGEVKRSLQEFGSWIVHRPKIGYCLAVPKSDDLVRRGRHFWNLRTREGFEKAAECFRQAAEEDGTDFRAFEGLCVSYLLLGTYGMQAPREMYRLFLDAHSRAVALTGLTAELRSHRAHAMHMFERRYAEAESDLLQVQREKPEATMNYVRLAILYGSIGAFDKAFVTLAQAKAVDPLWPLLPATEASFHFLSRQYDAAVACGKAAIELHPFIQIGRYYYAQALEFSGRIDEALEEYRHTRVVSPGAHFLRALEAACLARNGYRDQARDMLDEIEQIRTGDYVDAYHVALVYEALGIRDRAFCELQRAFEENSIHLCLIDVDPKMDPLRSDPRFPVLRGKILNGAMTAHSGM
jgi:DNA-binding winged helix-turn-helix (wHTH) protein